MTNWIDLRREDLQERLEDESRRYGVNVYLSPYDIPEAVKCEYNHEDGIIVIGFRYIDSDEPTRVRTDVPNGGRAVVGKHSNRLYKLSLPVDLNSDYLFGEIKDIISSMANSFSRGHRPRYGVLMRIIDRFVAPQFEECSTL